MQNNKHNPVDYLDILYLATLIIISSTHIARHNGKD